MRRCKISIGPTPSEPSIKGDAIHPTIWFASMASLAGVLSDENRALLKLIDEAKPQSLTDLAELTGRKVSNLSRTLRTMASYGIVELRRGPRGMIPVARATRFTLELD
ncbi:MAG: helix-turn-helix domain-containing protein [Pseudomonadota bacterium]